MFRRQARLRREFLYLKSKQSRNVKIEKKKDMVKNCLFQNTPIHRDIQDDAVEIQFKSKYDTINNYSCLDDEYMYAGCEDPKIMITTSHEPSARLNMFVKELRLTLPNCQRINRGKYDLKQVIHSCKLNNVTDLIIVHEHRGVPDNLVICHLPHGPTAFFNISGVVMRHDIPDINHMSEQKPHLVFHNFKTNLGERVVRILKYIFPVPKVESKRVVTFANHDDFISFRHHTYEFVNKQLELKEAGPRFQLKLYEIKLGTLDEINSAYIEWIYKPFMNISKKKRFLSDDDGWDENHKQL